MNAAEMSVDNPFPAEAVMTFGPLPRKIARLKFMTAAFEPVRQYLIGYSRAALESGPQDRTALGLSGENGSGKTFLLAWIKDEINSITRLPGKVAYAKADTPLFVNIYRQLLRNFTQPVLQEVVAAALRRIAIQRTATAFATEGRSQEIDSGAALEAAYDEKDRNELYIELKQRGGAALEAAYDEKILDRNELYIELKRRIAAAGAPAIADTVAQMIGLLEDPELGQVAFDWLCGADPGEARRVADQGESRRVADSGQPRLPVTGPLLPAPTAGPSADAADIAVGALECIAALFAAAETPLVLMVDQLENFAVSDVPVAFWSSMMKKLAEQVRRQNGLVVFAGTRLAWDRVPPDVGPRLIGRDPFRVGNLELAEASLLLDAYHPGTPRFSAITVEAIHRLSGGNPREILQIAHRCWRDAGGELDGVDDAAVLRAARDGGTLTERAKLAVADIDRVFERMGLTGREFRLPDGTLVERLGTAAGGAQAVAVVLARATDPIQEVTTAQTMTRIREVLASVPSKPLLLVVPIGYRSDSVQRLIENISWVVPFDGTDFEARLQGSLNQMTVVPPPLAGGESAPLLDSVLQRLERLQTSLEELRIIRQDRAEATAVRLAEGTEKLAAPEREQREARTKWELVDGLEGVRSALDEGGREQERALVRSLLVANEVYVQNSAFDYLGGLYMDVLDLESSLERSARARGFPPGGETMAVQIRNLRAEIIRLARRSVMQRREPVAMLRLAAAAVAAVAGAAFAYFILLRQETGWLLTRGEGAAITAGFAAGAAALGGLAWWYVDTYRRSPQASYSGVAREFDTLRFKVTSWGGTPDHTRA